MCVWERCSLTLHEAALDAGYEKTVIRRGEPSMFRRSFPGAEPTVPWEDPPLLRGVKGPTHDLSRYQKCLAWEADIDLLEV